MLETLLTVKVVVPDTDGGQENGQIVLERRLFEMLVDSMGSFEQRLKVIIPDHQRDRQSDRTPQTVSPTNPVPELEHV